ncbi:glutathione S-transferase family protein [Caulobacter sp. NIBR2454]|uniref:glutathione S-transferase family protein n=1 Tax=Caulobacter sp. NIBR2454 TaxID=3015996 RepID=UPI0022B690FE|nr:glutathione S-transferase family protein [Caulobacter sp. NIBR2454]
MELVVGTKKWSSWSMRPWLVLRRAGIDFQDTLVPLREFDASEAEIGKHSPSNRVPVLKDRGVTIWDSLAICEYLAETLPQAKLWPEDQIARALGRSAAEMHSGFAALRDECPMALDVAPMVKALSADAAKDVRRIVASLADLLTCFGGPFLLGEWSITDAFYTPVASRFRTYGIDLAAHGDNGAVAAYCRRLLETPEFLAWESDALAE